MANTFWKTELKVGRQVKPPSEAEMWEDKF